MRFRYFSKQSVKDETRNEKNQREARRPEDKFVVGRVAMFQGLLGLNALPNVSHSLAFLNIITTLAGFYKKSKLGQYSLMSYSSVQLSISHQWKGSDSNPI